MRNMIRGFWSVLAIAVMILGASSDAMAQCSCDTNLDGYTVETQKKKVHMELGVGIGGVYTGLSSVSSNNILIKPRYGLQGHLDIAVCIGKNFAIETEVAYEGGSMDVVMGNMERRVKTKSVDIPVLLSLRILNNRIRINAGPLFTVMSNAEYTMDGNTYLFGQVSPTWNLAGGIGIRISKHWLIEARYVHSLEETINQFGGKEAQNGSATPGLEFHMRNYRISAGVTLIF